MPEENTSANPQAGAASDIQPQPQAGAPDPQAGDGSTEPISLEAAKKLRSENANLRKSKQEAEALLAELKAFKEQIDAEKLTTTEKQALASQKLQKERDQLQAERDQALQSLKETRITHAVTLQAQKLGFNDPNDARLYLDESQLNEDLTNVEELLKGVIKTKPWLVGKQSAPTGGGATSPSRSQTSGPQALSWDVIGSMKPEEYAARSAEIQQWIAANPFRFGQRR